MNRFMVVRRNYSFLCFACCTLVGVSGSYAGENEGTTFIEVHFDGLNGVTGLNGAMPSIVSPDGTDVYVGSATDAFAVPNLVELTHFRRDLGTGRLAHVSVIRNPVLWLSRPLEPWNFAFSGDGNFLYVVFDRNAGLPENDAIALFLRDPSSGALTFASALFSGADDPNGVSGSRDIKISADGRHLYVCSFRGKLSAFARDTETGALTHIQTLFHVDGVQPLAASWSLDIAPDGAHVYVAARDSDAVSIFSRNAESGQLTPAGFVSEGADASSSLERPWDLAVSPDGNHVYVAARRSNGSYLTVFARNVSDGGLSFVETWINAQDRFFDEEPTENVIVSPDGKKVYVISRRIQGSVSVFERDSKTGKLSPEETLVDGAAAPTVLRGAGWAAMTPNGEHIYIPSRLQNALTVLSTCLPTELCDEFPLVEQEFVGFQEAFPFTKGFDNEGLPPDATVALVEGAACDGSDFALRESSINAYHINRATYDFDSSANSSEVEDLKRAISVLMLISDSMQVAVKDALLAGGVTLADQYVAVTCASGECLPNRGSGPAPRLADEPFSGSGDADGDGISNLDEYLAITSIGGTIADFVAVALNPALDGSVIPVRAGAGGGGGCLIATAAYGTPLAQDLDTLRAARDSYLMTNPLGAAFADTYYRISPPIADAIAQSTLLRRLVRALLVPVVFIAGANSVAVGIAVAGALSAISLAAIRRRRRSHRIGVG